MWIDSHCHLNHENLTEHMSAEEAVQNARATNISGMLTINCRIATEFDEILNIARAHDNVWCTVGTHPHDAGLEAEKAIAQEDIARLATSDTNVVGIGETGLDYYYDHSTPEDQAKSLRKHLRACVETDMPVVIHSRDADEDMARILKEESRGGKLRGVLHCFSSGRRLAEEGLDLGFYVSFSGIITFKQAQELREIAHDIPLDRLLIETDAPFLAPVPYRGKVNQPAYVAHTGAALADLKNVSVEELAKQTSSNFFELFNRARAA